MATQQEVKMVIIAINKIIAGNNPKDAVSALKKYGYSTNYDILSSDQIEKALLELYFADPNKYFSVIREIPYREDITNWTTSPSTKQTIKDLAVQLGVLSNTQTAKIKWGDVWQGITDALGGSATSNPSVNNTVTTSALSPGLIIGIAIAAIIAIIVIFLVARTK